MEKFAKLITFSAQATLFLIIVWITLVLGVEKKSLFSIITGLFAGGAVGFIAGAIGFAIVGTVGWVAGAAYGAVGLVSFLVGGSLGGLALGGIADVLRNPSHYDYNYLIIILGISIALYAFKKSEALFTKVIYKGISKLNRKDDSLNSDSSNT
jgi:hypothetical protein